VKYEGSEWGWASARGRDPNVKWPSIEIEALAQMLIKCLS
jgi:hypothetical protein